jgi:hypothetical protein
MQTHLIANSRVNSLSASIWNAARDRARRKPMTRAGRPEQATCRAGDSLTFGLSLDFQSIRLSRPDPTGPHCSGADARPASAQRDEDPKLVSPCGDRLRTADLSARDTDADSHETCHCPKCSLKGHDGHDGPEGPEGPVGPEAAVPLQTAPVAPPVPTYTFNSRSSYGDTAANFTRPACTAVAAGGASLSAGAAAPVVRVFPNGTYRVTRNDGVVQTATCTRLAAGLAATQTHENSHAAGATNAVAAANTAAGLPRNFAAMGDCTTALATWNASVNAAWANEVSHGPGTLAPTAQTFTEEHAAGGCTFA